MKYKLIIIFLIALVSCNKEVSHTVLMNNKINTTYLKQIPRAEKALLSWYLYSYGNACDGTSDKPKCKILKVINVTDECDSKHLNMMLQWFSNDMSAAYKLNRCPNLPKNSAIQNEFESIIIKRNNDILAIDYTVKGLNNSQEKSWNVHRVDKYKITSNNFVKLNSK